MHRSSWAPDGTYAFATEAADQPPQIRESVFQDRGGARISESARSRCSAPCRHVCSNPVGRLGNGLVKRPNGAKRIRTADLLGAIQALSQLSYSPARAEVYPRPSAALPRPEGYTERRTTWSWWPPVICSIVTQQRRQCMPDGNVVGIVAPPDESVLKVTADTRSSPTWNHIS